MRFSFLSAFHYIVFFTMAVLSTPAGTIATCDKAVEIKGKEITQTAADDESTAELLHSEILFRF